MISLLFEAVVCLVIIGTFFAAIMTVLVYFDMGESYAFLLLYTPWVFALMFVAAQPQDEIVWRELLKPLMRARFWLAGLALSIVLVVPSALLTLAKLNALGFAIDYFVNLASGNSDGSLWRALSLASQIHATWLTLASLIVGVMAARYLAVWQLHGVVSFDRAFGSPRDLCVFVVWVAAWCLLFFYLAIAMIWFLSNLYSVYRLNDTQVSLLIFFMGALGAAAYCLVVGRVLRLNTLRLDVGGDR